MGSWQNMGHRVLELSRLKELRASLSGLSLRQGDLFNQAIKCAEFGLYRSSHVMAWVAFVDCLQEKLVSDNLVAVLSL